MITKYSVANARFLLAAPAIVALICGCLSLDPFLWKEEPLDEYQLDSYAGEMECADAIDTLLAWGDTLDTSRIHHVPFSSEGETIWAILLAEDSVLTPQDTLILYFYGRTRNIDFYWTRVRLLHATGFPTMVVDYRGYGKSTGEPSEDALYADGRAALSHIRAVLGAPTVMLYAYSTGTWIGCELVSTDAEGQIARLMLEAPYNSVETMIQDATYLNLPGSYLTTLEGKNADKIKKADVPFLWLHGMEDQTLNIETHGYPVWENYRGQSACRILVPSADHTEVPSTMGYRRYVDCIRAFIKGDVSDPLFECRQ
ncbi:MAG: hypothetical protein GF418_10715 [Chitinivibrionales bacterium]|nr:hypothetical protein [Chitinivibrionales bacterium]MBD3396086.1 hypothetical protein [Chitinivibrionales bacterium]